MAWLAVTANTASKSNYDEHGLRCGATLIPGFPRQETVPGTRMPALDEVFALAGRGKFLFNIQTKITPRSLTLDLS